MGLIFDRRGQIAGGATHAIIVGVSEYQYLPGLDDPPDPDRFRLKRLCSPALSATQIAGWLIANGDTLARPLASCRLLISPSVEEAPKLLPPAQKAGLTGSVASPADWETFVKETTAWRADASQNRLDSTLFYFAGHGLQRLGNPLLALADFLNPAAGARLSRSVELQNLLIGMAPLSKFPDIARSQLYFIDACREEVSGSLLMTTTGSVFEGLAGEDDRTTPVYQGTYPGSVAQAIRGEPTDFCKALINGFSQGAENRDSQDPQRRWPVTTFTLHRAMANHFAKLATGQFAPIGGTIREENLRWLPAAPSVDLSVVVNPDPAIDCTTINVSGAVTKRFLAARALHPYKLPVPAGIYRLDATAAGGPYTPYTEQALINQANACWSIAMETR